MTAISPLQTIHKKGTFGDHHKKNEKDLLQISEVKNLKIIQIVQYKKSKINIQIWLTFVVDAMIMSKIIF